MFSNKSLMSFSILINLLNTSISASEMEVLRPVHRIRRQLLWPNSTVLQFNAGVGIPSAAKNINVNYAFQANFQLPWNRTQIPIDILEANSGYTGDSRKRKDSGSENPGYYQDDAKLHYFYKHVEEVLNGFGYNGKTCVLHTLCQLGAEPLHSDDEEDLLHEIAAFVLNPTYDAVENMTEKDEAYPYIQAFTKGQQNQDCEKLYKGCSLSFIDVFTKLHDGP